MRHLLGVALLAAITPCVWAQSFMGPVHSFPRPNFPHPHHLARTGASYPVAFFDPLYTDYYGPPATPETRVIIAQAPAAPPEAPAEIAPPAEPLLLELQDKQYVQLSGEKQSRVQTLLTEEGSTTRQNAAAPPSAPTLQNVVLVFRDGHTEEFSAYTIADGYLYASSGYYTSGSRNRQIDLDTLNLPETIKENEFRGISFRLPSAANEVIVGP
jgi:hypothetical protein